MVMTSFSNRKQYINLYFFSKLDENSELLSKLGSCKTGKSCLYIKRLSDINVEVLEEMIKLDFDYVEEKYGFSN
tara:strand:+ start:20831 stop:21052 length:222 start_codon:yes stop_codon:yes gene_type:complete